MRLGRVTPTRDFNYVKDVCCAFLELSVANNVVGQEINIATGVEISIEKLVNLIARKLNRPANIIVENERLRPEKSEVERLLGSNEKIYKLTDWRPRYDLDAGLDETIAWFRDPHNLKKYKEGIYNV